MKKNEKEIEEMIQETLDQLISQGLVEKKVTETGEVLYKITPAGIEVLDEELGRVLN